ncbi:Epidermal growth factor-binding protein type B [Entomophthora muscae]|uniref:Epidermal growth factor-binding protein type B n=1 Tax=Entomophthora muscae TaxID=34485 RepID=A0ACC2T3A3_9FUNG|nr:Epidermal growth factor-binding protein type B [Entomophthora muscae]
MYFLGLVAAVSADLTLVSGNILGGREVAPKFKYDWITSLAYQGNHMCGGVMLNSQTVLTAAHCVFGEQKDWVARFHRHNISMATVEEMGRESKLLSRAIHPDYNKTGRHENDIAALRVTTRAASFIFLDTGDLTRTGVQLHVIGWGITEAWNGASSVLREVFVPVFPKDKCKVVYPELDASQFCAGYAEGGKDACKGDSGGPIFYQSQLGYTLVGLVSYGEGCAEKGYPGVYTSIAATKQFILYHLYKPSIGDSIQPGLDV